MADIAESCGNFYACADWYVRCLEDVQDGRAVRGLGEAKAGYDAAKDRLLSALGKNQSPRVNPRVN